MTHPLLKLAEERYTEGVSLLKRHLSENRKWPSVTETVVDLKASDLKSDRDSEVGDLPSKIETPWKAWDAAKANFAAACYRDARYASGRRRYHQMLGLSGTLRGLYEGARLAVDNIPKT